MANLAIRLKAEPIRSAAFGDIGAGYTAVGDPLANPSRLLVINNLTDTSIMISFDGVEDHIALGGSGSFVLDITSNKGVAGGLFMAQGTTFYVKEIVSPTSGALYISSFYGDNGY